MRSRIELLPLGATLEVEPGTPLEAALAGFGFEFPCGGAGICQGCRVRVIAGSLAVTPEMELTFTPAELAAGWRLACQSRVEGPLALEVAQWEMPVLADDTALAAEAGVGTGIAIDLGTTTLVAQAVDLASGNVLGVATGINPQAIHGADVMTRIGYALSGGGETLTASIREAVDALVRRLPPADAVMIAGNTAMHHLFCGIDVAPLASAPFEPRELGEREVAGMRFLPCLGGFVGSDLLAGIMATGIAESADLCALIDLGTNGEIVLGNRERILCASTAAGPAFEGGRIRMGMRAAPGAIAHVKAHRGALECRTIGSEAPRGICGSGLVDAVAAGLEIGAILPNGRMAKGAREMALAGPVSITQGDVRELQLAKGAIAAGLRILCERWGAETGEIRKLYLAGAFGNYVDIESARRIGLLEISPERIVAAGNTSLRGVKMALLCGARREAWIAGIRARIEHVPLAADAGFQDAFLLALELAQTIC